MIYELRHCPPNPSVKYADSIVLGPQYSEIVSIGGGSTIDVGKWLARKYKLRHTAIPTTAGTGSEVTRYSVLTVAGKKITYELDVPNSYVLDPRLIVSLPPLQTLASGLDALSQCIEALWSVKKTMQSQNFAAIGIQLITDNFKRSLEDPTDELARMNMLLAANFSGRAIELTKTNVCHAISYPLTELYDIPHGIACAMSLRYFATKIGMTDMADYLLNFYLPKYKDVDPEKVAKIAIRSEKLKDYPLPVTQEDIVNALS